tara:strand:- start:24411 stop:25058 length:648 start_codon:yes stop_codon:yes gene_type:complete
MPLWGSVDNAANSVISAVQQVSKGVSTGARTSLFGNTNADVYIANTTIGQFGVDTTEIAAANGVAHAGWVLRTAGAGLKTGRVFYETLVASGSITGDAEDTTMVDYRIVITTQPLDSTENTANAVGFTVVATTIPTGGTITYQWQVDGGPGILTWGDVANTGVYLNTVPGFGNSSATLWVDDNSGLSGNTYRANISVTGGASVFTSNVVLTEPIP